MNLWEYAAAQAEVIQTSQPPPAPRLAIEQEREVQEELTNPYRLLLTAADCIGKLTGDTVFSTQAHDTILLLYGDVMGDPNALEIELAEVETRLENLRRYQGEHGTETRVSMAIRQHENRAQELRNKMGASS